MMTWVDTLRSVLAITLRPPGAGSDVRIQTRYEGGPWRDHCSVTNNPESVQGGLLLAGSTGLPVRAVDRFGRVVDFQ